MTDDFVTFFRISIFLNPALVFSMTTGSIFIGTGRGVKSLILVLLRTMFFTIPCTLTLGILLDYGLRGVWAGIVLGNWAAALLAFVWGKRYLRDLDVQSNAEV
ncbi:MAG: hypothetical protein GY866_32170 [Proteobacteria bacterium]|nr:hypothetical protein [Pseudomonadota bacterium]